MAVYVIAEAGVNHNGELGMALELVEAAAAAGADAVKFQTFKAEHVISSAAPKAAYQQRTTDASESQLDMVRKLELDAEAHRTLVEHCQARDIDFLSTPFDLPSIDLLVGELGLEVLKIPSGEITNAPLLLKAARTGAKLIVSTGMSTLDDVEQALGVIAFGYFGGTAPASRDAFADAYASAASSGALRDQVRLLHCTTEYPAPPDEVNLKAMDTLSDAFGLPVGYSDHTRGISIAIAAAARGAVVVEKHFTLDRSLPGPDHKASLEPDELTAMIDAIRTVEPALGDGEKRPTTSEQPNMAVARKSLVAARDIRAGEPFTEESLTAKRPGTGISPMEYWDWLGRPANRDYPADALIEP